MSHFTLGNSPQGPIVNAFISVSEARENALKEAELPVPDWVRIRGLIDTGASITCIDPTVLINSLALSPRGNTSVFTPSTGAKSVSKDLYDIGLWIPPGKEGESEYWFIIRTMAVICTDLREGLGCDALIGRDMLERRLFVYNGGTQQFSLAY